MDKLPKANEALAFFIFLILFTAFVAAGTWFLRFVPLDF